MEHSYAEVFRAKKHSYAEMFLVISLAYFWFVLKSGVFFTVSKIYQTNFAT